MDTLGSETLASSTEPCLTIERSQRTPVTEMARSDITARLSVLVIRSPRGPVCTEKFSTASSGV